MVHLLIVISLGGEECRICYVVIVGLESGLGGGGHEGYHLVFVGGGYEGKEGDILFGERVEGAQDREEAILIIYIH